MSIKFKLIISFLMLIIFTVGVLGILAGKKSEEAVFNEVIEKSKGTTELINTTISVRNDLLLNKSYSDLNFVVKLLNELGSLKVDNNEVIDVGTYKLPALYAGNTRLTADTTFVDKVTQDTGTIASIFLLQDNKLIRISTTLENGDGRAVATYFDSSSDVYNKIINNEEYNGRNTFDGETYISRFKPLYDKEKKLIGAIGVGNTVLNSYLISQLTNIKIGKTGYVYVIDSKGNCIIHPDMVGQNASEYDFVQKIISTKSGEVDYTYKGIHKLAFYKYFEPWDMFIVTTANYEDLQASSQEILKIIILIGGVISLFGIAVALFITKILVKPINKLKKCIEIAGKGDLTIRSDIRSKDEIGVLSDSFNHMMDENKTLMEKTMEYDKLKTEFISNMSHELKTPLNIIFCITQIYFDSIKNDEILDGEKLNNYMGTIKQNCYRLLRLVNNLIDISKIDSEFMELNLKNENIVEVIEEITQSTAEYVQSKGRIIIFDTDTEEKIIAFDAEVMERILLNLISNATKFTEPGDTIEVTVYDKGNNIEISVKDNGIGIPQDKIPQIFQRFKQVDPLLNRRHEGSGIGLALVKSLVEMHNGTIDVKSQVGEGTEFIIVLPAIKVSEDSSKPKQEFFNQSKVEKIHIEFSDIYD